MDNLVEYYIIACTVLLWLGITVYGIHLIRSKWHVLKFIPVEATITGFSAREVAAVSDYDFSQFGTVETILMVSYKFVIDGKVYSNTHDFGKGIFDRDKIDQQPMYKGKKVDQKITVYYNPEDPADNYLHRQFVLGGIITICCGQLFLVLTIHLINKWI